MIKSSKHLIKTLCFFSFLIGITNIFSAVSPSLPSRLKLLYEILPLEVANIGRLTTVFIGFALILLSINISRGKRNAWIISVLVLSLNIVSHLTKGIDYEEAFASFLLLLGFLFLKKYFTAKSDRPSLFQGIEVLFFSFAFILVYGLVGFYILSRGNLVKFSPINSFWEIGRMFYLSEPPKNILITQHLKWFLDSFYFIGAGTLFYSFWMLLRPVILRKKPSDEEITKVTNIIKTYGQRSIDAFAFLPGRQYFFYRDRSFLAYKVEGEIALVLGGPVGLKTIRQRMLKSFLEFCYKNGWKPVFFQVPNEELSLYKKFKFKSLKIGNEAIINLSSYNLEGPKKKPLRYAINSLERLGFTFSVFDPPINMEILNSLKVISNEWLVSKHGSEKYFSVGAFSEEYLKNTSIATVSDYKGKIVAFVNFLNYGLGNLVIDIMRHREGIPSETMLFLFTKLILWARNKGFQKLSLGDASLYGVGEEKESRVFEKVLSVIFKRFNSFYNFKGLWVFKSKFQPDWIPVYLVYLANIDLGPSIIALIKADSKIGILGEFIYEVKKRFNLNGKKAVKLF